MASTDLHVNGPAFIKIALGTGDFARLGITVDGPDIDLDANFEDQFGDDWGPFLPTDVQYFGERATIRTELIRWDQSLLESVIGRIPSNTAGVQRSADLGTLVRHPGELGNSPNYFRLEYESSARTGLNVEKARRFLCCYPFGPTPFKPGTRLTRFSISWAAIPDALDGNLYTLV